MDSHHIGTVTCLLVPIYGSVSIIHFAHDFVTSMLMAEHRGFNQIREENVESFEPNRSNPFSQLSSFLTRFLIST